MTSRTLQSCQSLLCLDPQPVSTAGDTAPVPNSTQSTHNHFIQRDLCSGHEQIQISTMDDSAHHSQQGSGGRSWVWVCSGVHEAAGSPWQTCPGRQRHSSRPGAHLDFRETLTSLPVLGAAASQRRAALPTSPSPHKPAESPDCVLACEGPKTSRADSAG